MTICADGESSKADSRKCEWLNPDRSWGIGHYQNSQLHGTWKQVYPDGSWLISKWRNDLRHGRWLRVKKDGSWKIVNWKNGIPRYIETAEGRRIINYDYWGIVRWSSGRQDLPNRRTPREPSRPPRETGAPKKFQCCCRQCVIGERMFGTKNLSQEARK